MTVQVPKLLFHEPGGLLSPCTPIIAGFAILAAGFAITVRRERRFDDALTLLWLVLASCFLIYVASNAGSMRGWTVRYIAPLYLVVPVFCAIGLLAYRRRLRWLAVIAAGLLVEVEKKLGSSPDGLTQAEAQKRLTEYGPNDIQEKKTNPLLKFLGYFWGPDPVDDRSGRGAVGGGPALAGLRHHLGPPAGERRRRIQGRIRRLATPLPR